MSKLPEPWCTVSLDIIITLAAFLIIMYLHLGSIKSLENAINNNTAAIIRTDDAYIQSLLDKIESLTKKNVF